MSLRLPHQTDYGERKIQFWKWKSWKCHHLHVQCHLQLEHATHNLILTTIKTTFCCLLTAYSLIHLCCHSLLLQYRFSLTVANVTYRHMAAQLLLPCTKNSATANFIWFSRDSFSWPATYDYYFLAAFDSLLIILLLLVMDSSSSPCYYYFRLATSGILGRFIKTWQLKESFSHQRHQRFHPFGKRAPTPSVSRSPLFLSFLFASPSSPPPLPHILSPVCLNSHPFSTFFLHCSNAVTPRHRTSFPLHPMPCGPEP